MMEIKKFFALAEIAEMNKALEDGRFWGTTTLTWQEGKVVLWREEKSVKPSSRRGLKEQLKIHND
jgi:hypothetical protein